MYASLLRRCDGAKSLLEGMRVHNSIVSSGHEQDCTLGNHLVQMYGQCGSLENANDVFVHMHEHNIFSWTIMIKILTENYHAFEGLLKFQQMVQEGTIPNHVSFITIVSGCASQTALGEGKRMHVRIVARSFDDDIVVSSALVDMYNKCESVEDSWKVFEKMAVRNVVSWNSIIGAYVGIGKCEVAMELFKQMQSEGVLPTKITFASILGACDNYLAHTDECKRMHACISGSGMGSDVVVGTTLVNVYAKLGCLEEASKTFEMMPKPNAVSWNAIIGANIQFGQVKEALILFQQMQQEGNLPNRFTFASILPACASREAVAQGLQMHALVVGCNLESDVVVGNALINMYKKCSRLEDACMLFMVMPWQDVVSWNSLLAALVQHEQTEDALQLFQQMLLTGFMPDKVSLATVLSACACEMALAAGRRIHVTIIARGFSSDHFLSTSLMNMYGKSSDLESALKIFDETDERDVVVWTAMISLCAQLGLGGNALQLYQQMRLEGVIPNKATVMSVLDVCASQAALAEGKRIRSRILAHDLVSQISVRNALINMYTKCGNLKEAWDVFKEMPKRDVVTWTAMMAGHARLGHGKEAHQLFQEMKVEHCVPNKVTFINIIDACSHAGLVDEAYYFFASMSKDYGITPAAEHYNCMVDLLGRAGRLCEGEALINRMSFSPPALLWLTLLSACRVHTDVELGKRAAYCLFRLEPQSDVPHALLANIYAALGEWMEVSRLRRFVKSLKEHLPLGQDFLLEPIHGSCTIDGFL